MAESEDNRFNHILKLSPRRFHICDNPPFGVGLVLCNSVNEDEQDGKQFFTQHNGIPNCKPGIWTSRRRLVPNPFENDPSMEHGVECILYWVEPGTIDISQSVETWEEYERATREVDAQVKLSQIVPKGTKWRRVGSYFSDDGVCCVVSTEYLTAEAAEMLSGDEDKDFSFGGYLEILSSHDGSEEEGNLGFTIGGMNFIQDFVGAPPWVAVAEEKGKAIAVRIHFGDPDDDEGHSEGSEEGLSAEDDE